MGIHYENLDEITRSYMFQESQLGGHYMSPRLTEAGQAAWQSLLEEAMQSGNDDWLSRAILHRRFIRLREPYTRDGITRWRHVNQAQ